MSLEEIAALRPGALLREDQESLHFTINGLPRMTANELAAYLSMPSSEREKFDKARARRKEQAERREQINLAVARLTQMGLPIKSVECGVVTIDFTQMFVLA
jgi:hypothetical protein